MIWRAFLRFCMLATLVLALPLLILAWIVWGGAALFTDPEDQERLLVERSNPDAKPQSD